MPNTSVKQIDTRELFKERNPGLYKLLPNFFFKHLKKIVHQDEINNILKSGEHNGGIEFLNDVLDYFKISGEIYGLENLPSNARIIVASNHPLGSMDGLLLIKTLYDYYGCAKALVNDLLMNLDPLKAFFIGFNLYGSTTREIIKELNRILDTDVPILYFPSGTVSRRYKGKIQDPEWKKTFLSNAVHHNRMVVPTHITGRLSSGFYRKASLRRILGIKSNIEMLYLPDEMFKLKQPKLKITFGKAISPEAFSKNRLHAAQAEEIRKYVYELAKNPEADFQNINKL